MYVTNIFIRYLDHIVAATSVAQAITTPVSAIAPIPEDAPEPAGVLLPLKRKRQTQLTSFASRPMDAFRKKKQDNLLLMMVVKDLQPLSIVEDTGN